MRKVIRGIAAAALATLSLTIHAALPQAGLWFIDGEQNGKPGRGIQVERLGGQSVLVSYLGYRADGSSMFLQAAGKIQDDNKSFTANLTEYKNGTTIAGSPRSGEVARVLGPVSIEFTTASSGSITLPGEKKKSFSRNTAEDLRARLNNSFRVTTVATSGYSQFSLPEIFEFFVDGDQLTVATQSGERYCAFEGNLVPTGNSFSSEGKMTCKGGTVSASTDRSSYRFEDIKVDERGFLSMKYLTYSNPKAGTTVDINKGGTMFGVCIHESSAKGSGGSVDRCTAADLGLPQKAK